MDPGASDQSLANGASSSSSSSYSSGLDKSPADNLMASLGGNSAAPQQLQKSGAMYNQLEAMMAAVKKEALALEKMKVKLKELDDLKIKNSELKTKVLAADNQNMELERKLIESETIVGQLRNDMQHINDIFTNERLKSEERQIENSTLQNELAQCKNELIFFQRESQKVGELRKMNANLLNQVSLNGSKMEEDRLAHMHTIDELKKKCKDLEIANGDASKHFWNVSEEIKALKRENQLMKESQDDLESHSNKKLLKIKLLADRAQMCNEDYVHLLEARYQTIRQNKSEMQTVRKENENLKGFIATKDEAYTTLTSKFKALEDGRSNEKNDIKAKILSLNENILQLKSQNHELEREVSDTRHELALASGEIPRYEAEIESQRVEIQRSEQNRLQRESDFARDIKSLVAQRDEVQEKLQQVSNQLEASQAQARVAQQRFWEATQGTKDVETELREDNNKLNAQLQQKGLQVISLESEKVKMEEVLRNEVSSASNMVNTLRSELEKRLEELSAMRKERDSLKDGRENVDKHIEELQDTIKRQEASWKKAIEGDRGKIQTEIKHMMGRIKSLEAEKQELLREFDELMNQINESGKELGKVRMECEELKRSNEGYARDVDALNLRNREIIHELKMDKNKEEELRDKLMKLETQYKEDVTRLDSLVKESKKTAAQQVLDLSGRARDLMAEIEDLKSQKLDVQFSEKKALQEVEKAKAEVVIANQQHEQISQQMVNDITLLKRELQDIKMKSKIIVESKTKLEVETMNARLEMTKYENDMARLIDSIGQFEMKLKISEEEKAKLKVQMDTHDEDVKRLKIKIVEAENQVAKKNQDLERREKELHRVERESQAEIRRLRLQCNAAEQEMSELKPLLPMLQKEVVESKSNFSKLQQSTNSSVNGLLEELRSTEDILSAERKRFQQDIDNQKGKISELNLHLEKVKTDLEENMTKSRLEKSDRDMRILQLEGELDRTNRTFNSKDNRVEELEKQHQANRLKLHESKDKIDMLERTLIDLKSNLELELTQRRRLETRLRELTAAMQENPGNRGGKFGGEHDSPGGFKYSMTDFESGSGSDIPSPPQHTSMQSHQQHQQQQYQPHQEHSHLGNLYSMAGSMALSNASQRQDRGGERSLGSARDYSNSTTSTSTAALARENLVAASNGNGSTINNQMLFKDDDDILAEVPNDPRHWLSLQREKEQNPTFGNGVSGSNSIDRGINYEREREREIAKSNAATSSIRMNQMNMSSSNGSSGSSSMSPVIGRVSAKLAARALADNYEPGARGLTGDGDEGYENGNSGGGGGGGGGGSDLSDLNANANPNATSDRSSSSSSSSNAADDLIAKTQKFLNRKLNGASGGGNNAASMQPGGHVSNSNNTNNNTNNNMKPSVYSQQQSSYNKNNNENNPYPNSNLGHHISTIESVDSSDYKSAAEQALALANAAFKRQSQDNNNSSGSSSSSNKSQQQGPNGATGATYLYNDNQTGNQFKANSNNNNNNNNNNNQGLMERTNPNPNSNPYPQRGASNLSMFTTSASPSPNPSSYTAAAQSSSGRNSARSNNNSDDDRADDEEDGGDGDDDDNELERERERVPSRQGSAGTVSYTKTAVAGGISGLSYRVSNIENDNNGNTSTGSGRIASKKGRIQKSNSRPDSGNSSFESLQLPKIGSSGNLTNNAPGNGSSKTKAKK